MLLEAHQMGGCYAKIALWCGTAMHMFSVLRKVVWRHRRLCNGATDCETTGTQHNHGKQGTMNIHETGVLSLEILQPHFHQCCCLQPSSRESFFKDTVEETVTKSAYKDVFRKENLLDWTIK